MASDLLNLFCTLGEMKRNANEEQGLMIEDVLKGFCSLECSLYEGASLMEVSQVPLYL